MKILITPSTNHLTTALLCALVLLGLSLQGGNELKAQQIEAVEKVIAEPVHRVPKVALNVVSNPGTMAAVVNAVGTTKTSVPGILPSAIKTITQPVSTPAVADPVPSPLTVQPVAAPIASPAPHPLDDAVRIAEEGLERIRANVKDYSAILIKRERIDGELMKPEYMQVKIRRGRVDETGTQVPFSIYTKFIKPKACAGRELIWVKGKNEGKLCVHEGSGIISLKRFNLDPDGWLAMKGQRYPIYEAGMENLVVKLIEKASRDRAAGECEVVYRDGVKINGRSCSVIEVTHPKEREPYDFHIAKVYIDDELQLPIRYQSHIWPEPGSTKPLLLEEYTYLNIKVNQGFTDDDFSPDNPAYEFPGR